jgi:hypothetical protein
MRVCVCAVYVKPPVNPCALGAAWSYASWRKVAGEADHAKRRKRIPSGVQTMALGHIYAIIIGI